MKNVSKFFLSVLAFLPFKSVAFVASSKLITIAGEENNQAVNWDQILKEKSQLFDPYVIQTTNEQAYARFLNENSSKFQNEEVASRAFRTLIEKMKKDGTIVTDVSFITSGVPSRF